MQINDTESALEREPRTAQVGIYTGGSFVLDSLRVFLWFDTLDQLAEYLLEVQPEFYDMDEDDTAEYKAELAPLLEQLQRSGIDDSLRQQINQAAGAYVIDWWGSFDELAQGETEFAQGIVAHFLDEEVPRSLRVEELDDFVEHLAQSAW